VVGLLNLLEIRELSWELEDGLVGVHEPLLLEIDTFLNEDPGHGYQVFV